jgi:hypothetical protein
MAAKPSFLASETDDEGFTPDERAKMDEAPEAAAEEAATEQPEQEAAAEQEKPAGKEAQPEKEHGGDLGKALKEERDRRRASDERAERLERTFQEVLKRVPQAPQPGAAQQQKPAEPPKVIPDFNQDPIGNLQAQLAQAMGKINELQGHTQQTTAAQKQQAEYNQFVDNYRAATVAYSRTQPDFGEAYNWLAQNATQEIEARYPGISPQEVQQVVNAEEERIVSHAFRTGRNPAEAIYNFAKARGFKKEPPAPPENKLARLAAGQKAASSLSGGKNAPNGQDNLTLEYLASLQGDEFDKAWALMERKGLLG